MRPHLLTVSVALALGLNPARVAAYVLEVSDLGAVTAWPELRLDPPVPLQFRYNLGGSSRLGGAFPGNAALQAVLDASFGAWAGVETAGVRFRPAEFTSRRSLGVDEENLVVFTSQNPENFTGLDGPYIIGLTTTSFNPVTGDMVDADIQFNDTSPLFHLSLYRATGTPVAGRPGAVHINLRDVATHEVGHALGLDHGGILDSTMYFAASPGSGGLSGDDRAGISVLYPSTGFSGSTGVLRGRVTGPAPVFGAHVVAVDVATGAGRVGALTGTDGTFVMRGVPPGRYVVVAEALRPNALGSWYGGIAADLPTRFHATGAPDRPQVLLVGPGRTVSGADVSVSSPLAAGPIATTPGAAISLDPGQPLVRTVPAQLTGPLVEYFSVEGRGGTTMTFNVTAYRLWMPLDPTLELLDASLARVAGPSTDLRPIEPFDRDDRLIVTLPGEGRRAYFLKVTTRTASAADFPDFRSVKPGAGAYLLTVAEQRDNTSPVIRFTEEELSFRVTESSPAAPVEIVVDLAGRGEDAEDPPGSLRWNVMNVPEGLLTVLEARLHDAVPTLVLRPRDHRSGVGVLDLVLLDADGASARVPVRIQVDPVDDPPVLDLHLPLELQASTIAPRALVLDASASTAGPVGDLAESGQRVGFRWDQTAGPAPEGGFDPSSPRLVLFPRAAGDYRFRLTVVQEGAEELRSTREVAFQVENLPPRAGPVPPMVAAPGARIEVDGRLSGDANEDLEADRFTLLARSGNPGPAAIAPVTTGVFAVSLPAAPGHYLFDLVVVDGGSMRTDGSVVGPLEARAPVEILVQDGTVPTAFAGLDRVVATGDTVELGPPSTSNPAPRWTFRWAPDPLNPAAGTLSSIDVARPRFTAPPPPAVGAYRFDLVVEDPDTGRFSSPDDVWITVVNPGTPGGALPSARARILAFDDRDADGSLDPWEGVILDGGPSRDPERGVLAHHWIQILGPPIHVGSGATPVLVPPAQGTYEFELRTLAQGRRSPPFTLEFDVGEGVKNGVGLGAGRPGGATLEPADPPPRFVTSGLATPADRIRVVVVGAGDPEERTYIWEQTEGPRSARLPGTGTHEYEFLPVTAGVHGFRVWARDRLGRWARAGIQVVVDGPAGVVPEARLGARPMTPVAPGVRVSLDGSPSGDPDLPGFVPAAGGLVHHWVQLEGAPTPLLDADGPHPVLVPPVGGVYRYRLRVGSPRTGLMSAWAPGEVLVEVSEAALQAPAPGAGPVEAGPAAGPRTPGCAAGPVPAIPGVWILFYLLPWIHVLALRRRWRAAGHRIPGNAKDPDPLRGPDPPDLPDSFELPRVEQGDGRSRPGIRETPRENLGYAGEEGLW